MKSRVSEHFRILAAAALADDAGKHASLDDMTDEQILELLRSPTRSGVTQKKGGLSGDARQGKLMSTVTKFRPEAKVLNPVEKGASGEAGEKMAARAASLISVSVEVVTAEVARRWRDNHHFPRQRNIAGLNLGRLSHEMREQRFTQGTQIYFAILPDGTEYILNGNHTLEAIAATGIPQALTITRKKVKDEDDAGEIYAVFDVQKVRTMRDSARAVGGVDDIKLQPVVMAAMGVIGDGFGARSPLGPARMERLRRMVDYKAAAELLAKDVIYDSPKHMQRIIKRAAIAAVALETLRYQPSNAVDFWRTFVMETEMAEGSPQRALRNWGMNNAATGGTARILDAKAAATAWNGFWRDEKQEKLNPRIMAKFTLMGTPHANGFVKGA